MLFKKNSIELSPFQAGVSYEDNRLPAPWDDMAPWTALKPNTPFGQLPTLCVDGQEFSQSMSIAR